MFRNSEQLIRHLSTIIESYTKPHDIVLDLAAGEGWTSYAALLLKRRSIHVDKSPLSACITRAIIRPFHCNTNAVIVEDALSYLKTLQLHADTIKDIVTDLCNSNINDDLRDLLLLALYLSYNYIKSGHVLSEMYLKRVLSDVYKYKCSNRMHTIAVNEAFYIRELLKRGSNIYYYVTDMCAMPKIPDKSISLVICDYPVYSHPNSLLYHTPPKINTINCLTKELARILTPQGALALFLDKRGDMYHKIDTQFSKTLYPQFKMLNSSTIKIQRHVYMVHLFSQISGEAGR